MPEGEYTCFVSAPGHEIRVASNLQFGPLLPRQQIVRVQARPPIVIDVVAHDAQPVDSVALRPVHRANDHRMSVDRDATGYFSVPYPPSLGNWIISDGKNRAVATFTRTGLVGAQESNGIGRVVLRPPLRIEGHLSGLSPGQVARVEVVAVWDRNGQSDVMHAFRMVGDDGAFEFELPANGFFLVRATLPPGLMAPYWTAKGRQRTGVDVRPSRSTDVEDGPSSQGRYGSSRWRARQSSGNSDLRFRWIPRWSMSFAPRLW